jgi:hypothetical protein
LSRVRALAAFLWSFLVGDDWRTAAWLALALAATALLTHTGVAAWWLMPTAVTLVLVASLHRLTARNRR